MEVFWKVILKVLAAIFAVAIGAGAVIFAAGGIGTVIEEFYRDPIGMTAASFALGGIFFVFVFGPINEGIDELFD